MYSKKTVDYSYAEKAVNEYFDLVMNHFPGGIVLTDNTGKILFVNNFGLELWKDSLDTLLGKHISVFRLEGWAPDTGTEYVLKNKTRSVMYFKTKYGDGLLNISVPVFGDNKEIQAVLTFSMIEEVVYDYIKKIEFEKGNMQQLISFLNRNQVSIIAESQEMREIFMLIDQMKFVDSTMMLYGESGTGKEVIAKYIHQMSLRNKQPFIPVNCATIPNELMEAEFFGYEKGAFTGASREGKLGLFELAHKGTLFLDEIGEMPLPLQAKFLRVLESGEIRRLGSEKHIYTDARIIAATNRDLEKMVQEGSFRSDLYYRLNILPVKIPPLRDRKEDIAAFIEVFLENFNKKYRLNRKLSDNSMKVLGRYSWPGNVRELRNAIERLVITTPADIIEISENDFPGKVQAESDGKKPGGFNSYDNQNALGKKGDFLPLKDVVSDFEKQYIKSVLDSFGGDVSETARQLEISVSGLYKKISLYNLS